MPTSLDDLITQIETGAFEALVAKGIHAILFKMTKSGSMISADETKNLLFGYPIGNVNTGGDSADSEEFQDQLVGGDYKNFVAGAIDGGDLTFDTYFSKNKGKPKVTPIIVNSTVFTPQFILMLGVYPLATPYGTTPTNLDVFFLSGVNYAGGGEIKGSYGKIVGSSLKFKITGEPKVGIDNCGQIAYTKYTAGGTA